jgi:hypothetical protein
MIYSCWMTLCLDLTVDFIAQSHFDRYLILELSVQV